MSYTLRPDHVIKNKLKAIDKSYFNFQDLNATRYWTSDTLQSKVYVERKANQQIIYTHIYHWYDIYSTLNQNIYLIQI